MDTRSMNDGDRMQDGSLYLSWELLRCWPSFAAAEGIIDVGTCCTLQIPQFAVDGEFVIGSITDSGILFHKTETAA